jgi:Uma2 family endonuclease
MSTASRLITYEDSLLLPEDKLSEVVKGELRLLPPPGLSHALLIERLDWLLRRKLDPGRFAILVSSFGQLIRREPFTYRIPDLGVYFRERLTDEHYISIVPELLVEVISPANRKGSLAELVEDYEALKLPELWLVQPEERRIHRRILEDGKLLEAGVFSEGLLAPHRVSSASISLSELWLA